MDAAGCPYCARVRIVLAEKAVPYGRVLVDLSKRPEWLYSISPSGKVPVLEVAARHLAESGAIMEYLEELEPAEPLLPDDIDARAEVRVWIWQHPERLSDAYYAWRRGRGTRSALEERLDQLDSHLYENEVPRRRSLLTRRHRLPALDPAR